MVAVLKSVMLKHSTQCAFDRYAYVLTSDGELNEKNGIDRLLVGRCGAARGLPQESHYRRTTDRRHASSGLGQLDGRGRIDHRRARSGRAGAGMAAQGADATGLLARSGSFISISTSRTSSRNLPTSSPRMRAT